MDALYAQLKALALRFHAEKLVLFGSRARGDARERSDVDLAVFGLDSAGQLRFSEALDELPTLLDFDVVYVTDDTAPALMENIRKDGVTLMNKAEEKAEKLKNAVQRLDEALAVYADTPSDVVRDGVIQRFEFCTELAWKAAREYLLDQGYTEINSPKSVMKKAYADGLIGEEEAWLALLNDRNLTSHLYDDAAAAEIFGHIRSTYLALLSALVGRLSPQ